MRALDRTRLMAVARKESIQLRRDPRSLAMAFLLPLFMLLMFGYAITWDVRDIKTAVVDLDRTPMSRDLVRTFEASGYFRVVATPGRAQDVPRLFERGGAQIGIVIPPRFEADVAAGRQAPLQVLVDGADANTATIALNYVRGVVQTWGTRTMGRELALPIRTESRVWYNEELRSRNMIVPGLVATIMMVIATMLTSLTIAREWERGTMEQLAATPVSRLEVVLGKLVPYVVIGFIDVAMVTIVGIGLFRVPFRGDVLLLAAMSFLFLLGSLGLGVFISAVMKSQLLASQAAMMTTYLPSLLLSGFMYSLDTMPWVLRVISHAVPARYFLVVTRGVFLKGVGLDVLWPQGVLMLLYAAIGLGLATRVFRKELT
jgi:ABC-2 type transport system permease protein